VRDVVADVASDGMEVIEVIEANVRVDIGDVMLVRTRKAVLLVITLLLSEVALDVDVGLLLLNKGSEFEEGPAWTMWRCWNGLAYQNLGFYQPEGANAPRLQTVVRLTFQPFCLCSTFDFVLRVMVPFRAMY